MVAHHQPAGVVRLRPAARARRRAALADLEFVQFHPTAVVGIPGREGFLLTEAIRGEGATLHDAHGERFVDELAPRDAVARAIFRILREQRISAVKLDMRHVDPGRFPNVVGALREAGLDPTSEPVPVAPASHYMMGGIVTDLDGRSGVPAVRGRGVRLHRPARRQPAGVELAVGVLRVRPPRRAAALDEPEPAAGAPAPRPDQPVAPPPTRETARRCGGTPASSATPRAWLRCWTTRIRSPAGVARSALFREECRGAHLRADFGHRSGAGRPPHGARPGPTCTWRHGPDRSALAERRFAS